MVMIPPSQPQSPEAHRQPPAPDTTTTSAPRAAQTPTGALLMPGDVIVTRSAGIIGALIRFGERIRYEGRLKALWWLIKRILGIHQPEDPGHPWWTNHTAVYVGDGQVIEALAGGLTLSPLTKYSPADYRIARLSTAEPTASSFERQATVAYAHAQLARMGRYGWLSIASTIVQLLTPLRLDVSWDGAVTCSAFAAQCWEHAGVIMPTRSALTTMPADFWRWVQ